MKTYKHGKIRKCSVSRKVCFKSVDDAHRVIPRIMANHGDERTAMNAYKCPHCGRWHLSSEGLFKDLKRSLKRNRIVTRNEVDDWN